MRNAPPLTFTFILIAAFCLGSATSLLAREIGPAALAQIQALSEEKRSRTPAQQKIDSRLLLELASRRGAELLEQVPQLRIERHADDAGAVLLDLDATVDDALLASIAALGGTVHSAFPRWNAVRATLPIDRLEDLASLAQVRTLRPADVFMTQKINTTEGDVAHAADDARATFNVDGSGVKVGAMSDSVDALADLIASGDLPPDVTVLPGQSGNPGTSEGTALLEIIFDMASGADLFFATGRGGQAQMAQNILDLAAAGCTVIVDDIIYLAEPAFQDGVIAQAVDEVAAQGVAYFSAAGNSGNLPAGTAGVWEGDYVGTALPPPLDGFALSAHDFGGGANSNELTFDTPFFITLQWSDPQDASDNDYDLFLLDPTLTTVISASTNTQDGTQDPFEILDSSATDDLGNRIVVTQFDGEDRFIHLNTHRGRLGVATDGQIYGHPAAEGAIAVGAVNVATAGGGEFTGGPANPAEPFTSDGPRRIFFEADGTPIGGALRGVQQSETRDVPDITAADGVSTATPGFETFFGTSASAPHAAGIAALIKEILSSLNATGARQRQQRDALDIEEPGSDPITGSGIPMADDAIEGKMGFQGDSFSANTSLATADGKCAKPHQSGTSDNTVQFDAEIEALDPYVNGTEPFLFEFGTDPDNLSDDIPFGEPDSVFEVELTFGAEEGTDLFPEGFEDPETGAPLTHACIEIGMEDILDADCPVSVTSAVARFFNPGGPVGDPVDLEGFDFFPDPSTLPIPEPGLVGVGISSVEIEIRFAPPEPLPGIFADGFATGDTSAWSTTVD